MATGRHLGLKQCRPAGASRQACPNWWRGASGGSHPLSPHPRRPDLSARPAAAPPCPPRLSCFPAASRHQSAANSARLSARGRPACVLLLGGSRDASTLPEVVLEQNRRMYGESALHHSRTFQCCRSIDSLSLPSSSSQRVCRLQLTMQEKSFLMGYVFWSGLQSSLRAKSY
ncbi:unnamed protein product [Urochloa humidicola]